MSAKCTVCLFVVVCVGGWGGPRWCRRQPQLLSCPQQLSAFIYVCYSISFCPSSSSYPRGLCQYLFVCIIVEVQDINRVVHCHNTCTACMQPRVLSLDFRSSSFGMTFQTEFGALVSNFYATSARFKYGGFLLSLLRSFWLFSDIKGILYRTAKPRLTFV